MYSTRYSRKILMKLEFSRQIFEQSSNIKLSKNPSGGSRVVPRRTDRHNEAKSRFFRNVANAPKMPGNILENCEK